MDYWDYATHNEKYLASKYPITIEQAVTILTLANNNFDLAEEAGRMAASGISFTKVRAWLFKQVFRM